MTGDKFIPELHLGLFTKYCDRIQKFRETGNFKHLHRNDLEKACFAHDTTYSDSKDLAKI